MPESNANNQIPAQAGQVQEPITSALNPAPTSVASPQGAATLPSSQQGATASPILEKLKTLEQMVSDQQRVIAKQQELLTSPEFLTGRQQPAQQQQQPELKTPQDLLAAIQKNTTQQIEAAIDQFSKQFTPLLKQATADAPVWNRTRMAEQIVSEKPNIDMETALELAEIRMAKQAQAEAAQKAEANKLDTQLAAEAASMGNKGNTSVSAPEDAGQSSLLDIMNKNWDITGMDEAQVQLDQESVDVWAPPATAGVQVQLA